MTGGFSLDVPERYTERQLQEMIDNREFAEFLPLEVEYDDDDYEWEVIEEDEDQDT